jgi:uncharacterized protein YraI
MHFNRVQKSVAVLFAILIAVFSYAAPRPTSAQAQTGRLRFVHAVPDASAIDVAIDKVTAISGLTFTSASRYLTVSTGEHVITVSAGGTPVFEGKVKLAATQALTVIAQGTAASIEVGVYEDDLSPTQPGKTRFTAVNAIKDVPAIDVIKIEGNPFIQSLKYAEPRSGFDIPTAGQAFAIAAAGGTVSTALVKTPALSLVAGTSNILVALGTSDKPTFLLLSAPCDADKPAASELVRFVHALSGGPDVDVYVGTDLVAPALTFGIATQHVALAAGSATITIRAAGSKPDSAALATANVTLAGSKAATVVIAGSASAPTATVVDDTITKLDPTTARVQVINATGAAGTVKLTTGTNVTTIALDAAKNPPVSEIPAAVYTIAADSVNQKAPLSGGVLYDIVAAGNGKIETLIIGATSLSEGPTSAPGAAPTQAPTVAATLAATTAATTAATSAPATAAATQAPTVAAPTSAALLPTTAPTQVQPTAVPPTQPAQATAAPTQPAQPTTAPTTQAVQPSPTSANATGITATVETNPGVNLKIREYPSVTARTLALVPSGSTLDVLGVKGVASKFATGKGTPTVTPTFTKVPSATPTGTFTAPSQVSDVWLFVSWTTPDGGNVTGWINIDYVHITQDGKTVSRVSDILAFKAIPEDTPGQVNGSVTPVSNTVNIIGKVSNVDVNVNVQIRRTPNINSESLGLLPVGSTVIVLAKTDIKATPVVGAPASSTWLFIEFDTDSGSIFGWVNSQYFTLTRNKSTIDLSQVPTATDITPGYTKGSPNSAAATATPALSGLVATVSFIQEGGNLQLRDRDDQNATSLALLPAGTQLQVLGRNGNGTWLQVKYNDLTGWVNVQYIVLTKNGKKIAVTDLKNVSSEPDILLTPGAVGSLTPTTHP